MKQNPTKPHSAPPSREQRVAEALRENLRKRKAQMQAKQQKGAGSDIGAKEET